MDLILDFLNKYRKTVILFAVFFVVLIIGLSVQSGQKNSVKSARAQVDNAESNLLIEQQKNESGISDTQSSSSLQGIDADRVSADAETMNGFLQMAFTFDSLDSYQDVRSELKETYDLREEDQFMKSFYPPVVTSEDDTLVNRYAYLASDSGNYQCEFEDAVPYLSRINSDEYTYVNLVTVTSNGKEYSFGVSLTVNGDSLITDAEGYAVLPENK